MFFVSLHSSKRKFAPAQYVNRERFLFPYLHSLFVICSSARATRTVFSSSFLYLPVRLAPSFVRLLFVFCSFIVRSLFVLSLSALVARTVFLLPAHRAMIACRATTARTTRTVVLTAHLLII